MVGLLWCGTSVDRARIVKIVNHVPSQVHGFCGLVIKLVRSVPLSTTGYCFPRRQCSMESDQTGQLSLGGIRRLWLLTEALEVSLVVDEHVDPLDHRRTEYVFSCRWRFVQSPVHVHWDVILQHNECSLDLWYVFIEVVRNWTQKWFCIRIRWLVYDREI